MALTWFREKGTTRFVMADTLRKEHRMTEKGEKIAKVGDILYSDGQMMQSMSIEEFFEKYESM